MINTILALAILWVAMYVSIQVINFIFAIFNFASKSEAIELKENQNKTWLERIIEAALEYLQWANFSSNSIHACDLEVGEICTEAASNVEGLEEGIQAIVESTSEGVFNAIANLSSS